MVEIQLIYEGQKRVRATHGPSGAQVVSDAPLDNHGLAQSFSPTDLVATALGACMLTIMGIVAERHQWPMTGAQVRVEKHMVAQPVRRIARLVVEIDMPEPLGAEARAALERAAHLCPVHASLHPDIAVELSIRYPGEARP